MGWKSSAKLSEIAEVIDSLHKTPKYTDDPNGYPMVRVTDINSRVLNLTNTKKVSLEVYNEFSKKHKSKVGDIVFSRVGSYGRSSIVLSNDEFCLGQNTAFIVPSINSEFLHYYLNSPSAKEQIDSFVSGSTQPTVSLKSIKNIVIPTPENNEQKRIVAILGQVFADIEQARTKTEQNLKNARELFESYLQQAFSNQIDNCMVRSMSDKTLLTMIDGDRGKNYPKKSEFLSEGHCLFLSTKNVRSDGFLFEQKIFIDEKLDSLLRKGKLERNDVVLTTRGTIGNLALYDDTVDYENIRINSGMLILRPNVAEILPSYLFEIMRSEIIRSQIEAKVSGAAQPQLPVNTLNTFTFPVPQSLGDQLKAVELIREAEVTIKKLIRIYNDKLASLDELKKSILQKAFSGELTKTYGVDTSKGAVA